MKFRIALAALFTAVALTACDKAEEVKQNAVEKTTETATEVAASATDKAAKIAEEVKTAAAEKAAEIAKAAEKAKAAAETKAAEIAEAAKQAKDEAAAKIAKAAEDAKAAASAKVAEMAKAAEEAKAAAAAKATEMAEAAKQAKDEAAAKIAKAAEDAKAAASAKVAEMAKAAEDVKAVAAAKIATAAATTAAMATTVAETTAAKAAMSKKTKVGFVYVGPIGDHGWSYQHNQSRLALEKELGVNTTYVESVPEGADAERVIRQLAADGNDVIFTTSFGYMNPTLKVAKKFPKVRFEHATGYKRSKNLSTYSARFYEGRAVLGAIAGKMTKTNTIGYIASFPIPEVIRGINAMTLAARKVNPDVKVKVVWVNTWFDPGKEGDAAKALIDQGADIITQHTDSPAPLQVAEKRGVYGFGQASNMKAFAPNAQLTAIVNNWDKYYIDRVKAAQDGSWTSIDTWAGIKDGMVTMAPYAEAIPQDVRDYADSVKASIVDGSFHPFQGPIKDQKGEVVVKAGETIADGDLAKMAWYVEGVDGTIPK